MAKDKKSLLARNLRIAELENTIKINHANSVKYHEIMDEQADEIRQLHTYRDRFNEVNDAINKLLEARKRIELLSQEVALWKHRANVLAIADRDNDSSMFSAESLGVLTDMDMLPKSMISNRTARRNTLTKGKITKHIKLCEEIARSERV